LAEPEDSGVPDHGLNGEVDPSGKGGGKGKKRQ